MSRPTALVSRDRAAIDMINKGDQNLGNLLKLPDNIFTKEDVKLSYEKQIHINKIIFYLYEKRKNFPAQYFIKLLKELIEVDIKQAARLGQAPQINFSYIDPNTNENLFLRAVYNNDLEAQEIIVGDNFNAKLILSLYEQFQGRALPLIKNLVKKDKEKAALTGSKPKIDLNFVNSHGENILLRAVRADDIEALKFLVSEGVNLDYQHPIKQGTVLRGTALINAISMCKEDAAKFLIASGANLAATNEELETPLMLALRSGQEDFALIIANEMRHNIHLQKDLTGDDALCHAELNSCKRFLATYLKGGHKEYSIALNAKKLLDLMYSQDDSAAFSKDNIRLQREFFERHKFGASPQDNPYLLIAKEIGKCIDPSSRGNRRINLGGGRTLEVVQMPIPGHAAFITVEYRKNAAGQDRAVKLSYCDGNLPLSELNEEGYAAGEVCFKVRNEWAAEANLGAQIAQTFKMNIGQIMTRDDEMKIGELKWLFANFVEKDHRGQPAVTESNIATVAQDRGNCSMKSLTILQRAIRKKTNPKLKFEEKDDAGYLLFPEGDGYEEFKEYKNFIIQNCLNDILEIAKSEGSDRNNSVYSVVLASLKSSLLQSASKKDSSTMLRIMDALRDRGFSDEKISQIINSKGQNIFSISTIKGIVRAASWCAKNGIELVYGPDRLNPLLILFDESRPQNIEILQSHLRNYHANQLNPDFARDLMLAALQSKNDLGRLFMSEMIMLGFDLASKNKEGVAFLTYAYRENPDWVSSLLRQTREDELLRSKMIEVYKSGQLSHNMYQWLAFSAIRVGSNEFALEMVRNGFPLTTQNPQGISLFDYSFTHSPKFITSLLQKDMMVFNEDLLSNIVKNAFAKIDKRRDSLQEDDIRLVAEYKELIEECSLKLKAAEKAPDLLVEKIAPSLPDNQMRKLALGLEKRASEKHLQTQQSAQVAAPPVPPRLPEGPAATAAVSVVSKENLERKVPWEAYV